MNKNTPHHNTGLLTLADSHIHAATYTPHEWSRQLKLNSTMKLRQDKTRHMTKQHTHTHATYHTSNILFDVRVCFSFSRVVFFSSSFYLTLNTQTRECVWPVEIVRMCVYECARECEYELNMQWHAIAEMIVFGWATIASIIIYSNNKYVYKTYLQYRYRE